MFLDSASLFWYLTDEKDITLDLCLRIATECAIPVALFCVRLPFML